MNNLQDDPRPAGSGDRPIVGSSARGVGPVAIVAVFAVLAVALFLFLNARRTGETDSTLTPSSNEMSAAAPPPPIDIAPRPAAALAPVPTAPPPLPAPLAAPAPPQPPDDTSQRLHAPLVVVDLQAGRPTSSAVTAAPGMPVAAGSTQASALAAPDVGNSAATGTAIGAAAGAAGALGSPLLAGASGGGSGGLNGQVSARVAEAAPDPSIATQMTNLGTTITQGATIPAVLETAINSDLPGLTRAVVSRDVLGFDGKNVLIPRGSRVIGQYRSALSLGQSRVFIIWTRVIRPDGVTVQIGSPGDDALGRGGLTGDVNSHFFSRFGGAILLSVLNGGIAAIAGTPSTEISIGSPAAAAGAAATASIPTSSADILPTISVKQGVPVSIFVARDLEFSSVMAVK